MRKYCALGAVALALLLGGWIFCFLPTENLQQLPQPEPVAPQPAKLDPEAAFEELVRNFPKTLGEYEGVVLAVDQNSITQKVLFEYPNGSPVPRPPGEPPRVFKFTSALAAGGGPVSPAPVLYPISSPRNYTRDHVQVGDIVQLACQVYKGEIECRSICIRRRPGGRVPCAPGDERIRQFPYHERMNAFQDFEEKGIPLPKKWGDERTEKNLTWRINHVRAILDAK